MTLNDNPRVTAERRRMLWQARLLRICERYQRVQVVRGPDGTAVRMVFTSISATQLEKKRRVVKTIHTELRLLEKFINSFK